MAEPRKFRKKPVEVYAHCFATWDAFVEWLEAIGLEGEDGDGSDGSNGSWMADDGRCMVIDTLEGEMTAQPGDWIICGVQNELCPCKPDIFEATYEGVSADA
jgi:hypothetical protein